MVSTQLSVLGVNSISPTQLNNNSLTQLRCFDANKFCEYTWEVYGNVTKCPSIDPLTIETVAVALDVFPVIVSLAANVPDRLSQ